MIQTNSPYVPISAIATRGWRICAALAIGISLLSLGACSKKDSPAASVPASTATNATASAASSSEGSKNLPTEANDLLKAQLDAVAKAKATASAVGKEAENMNKAVDNATK
ncbi:MAG: hypothetical protein HYZ45_01290 [Burkholderiales bacterium]|nr:hypothetical protein [Burkholderiales bacterium]